MAQEHC